MSDDEGATPLQAAFEAAPVWVTPGLGKGALGTRWPRSRVRSQTQCWAFCGAGVVAKGRCKPHGVGAESAPAPQLLTVGEGPL
jgi:hypothetical protein